VNPIDFLVEVWSKQGQGFGFVSLRRTDLSWYDKALKVPDDFTTDLELPDRDEGDLYFTPNLFSRPRRRKELMLPSRWLYADLDTVDPIRIEVDDWPRPTVAWESSPKRYQCLWLLDRKLTLAEHSQVNKQLTYAVGADKGGWDATQVLRLPGTLNHKYEGHPEVRLLWV
jgi:hypothetical protein